MTDAVAWTVDRANAGRMSAEERMVGACGMGERADELTSEAFMSGVPLHPLVVHFPVVLVVLLPIFALAALWAIRRGTTARRAWLVPLAVSLALVASAAVATNTGEAQEETVEKVVPERSMHEHEEAGERFLVLSGVLLLVMAVGVVPGTVGRAARLVATAGSVALVAAGIQVGHSGGLLVYRDNAASAYATPGGAAGVATREAGREREADDR